MRGLMGATVALAALLTTTLARAADPPNDSDVKLDVVKWAQLEKAIASHKGKVVVIDVWAEY